MYAIRSYYGNDKDRPEEIESLLEPIRCGEATLVQGSRYLNGGRHGGMPLYRRMATRYVHPILFSLAAGIWAVRSTPLDARITSYNVCYTKLLRLHQQPPLRYRGQLRGAPGHRAHGPRLGGLGGGSYNFV